MRYIFSILFLSIIISTATAQDFPSELLHEGKVTLANGDTLSGNIKYDMENDLIQIVYKGTIQTYSARKLMYFTIYDNTVDMFRTFYSIPYEIERNYERPLLFEVLYEGKLSLLAREKIVTETVPQYSYAYRSSVNMTRTKLDYEFFFLDHKGHPARKEQAAKRDEESRHFE